MLTYRNKVISNQDLSLTAQHLKQAGKKIVQCYGNFNVVHPGHLRFLEFAKRQGDALIVTIASDHSLEQQNIREYFFDETERADGVAAVAFVDYVSVANGCPLRKIIHDVQPDVYVKGKEYELASQDIQEERDAVHAVGGRMIFGSGAVHYDSADILLDPVQQLDDKNRMLLRHVCHRNGMTLTRIQGLLDAFSRKKVFVVGDVIVDQYVSCDALGMSSEAPVLAIRELENREFLGGAGVVASHIQSLGAQCSFLSIVGDDTAGHFVEKELRDRHITSNLVKDFSRPTTYKTRYLVNQQKILRVSRLQDHSIAPDMERQLLQMIRSQMHGADAVIISDFVYGIMTDAVIAAIADLACAHGIKVFADLQCSSQIGDVSKYRQIELITPTEREARIALSDKDHGLEWLGHELLRQTGNNHIVMTLGKEGLIAFSQNQVEGRLIANSQHFPAFKTSARDPAGAGDALLAAMALSLCCGATIIEASLIGSAAAALEVDHVGNVAIRRNELRMYIQNLGVLG